MLTTSDKKPDLDHVAVGPAGESEIMAFRTQAGGTKKTFPDF